MIIRQLKEYQYNELHRSLMKQATAEPLDASYTVNIKVNDMEYAVKLQPEEDCKVAVLQALRIERSAYGPDFELITESGLLSSLFEMIVYQGVR